MAYNPSVRYRGDAYLFEGLSNMGQSLAQGITESKRKVAETKGMRTYLTGLGVIDNDQAQAMGLSELKGLAMLEAEKQRRSESQGIQDLRKAQQTRYETDTRLDNEKALTEGRLSQGLSRYNQEFQQSPVPRLAQAMTDPNSGVTLSQLQGSAQQLSPPPTPFTAPVLQDILLSSGAATPERLIKLQEAQQRPDLTLRYHEDPITGERYAQFGKQILPSGLNPRMKDGTANPKVPQEQFMADGTSTGWALFPDGEVRRLPGKPDAINAAQFDLDNDGVISDKEWPNAMLAEKFGGIYPGMLVNPDRAASGGASGGLDWSELDARLKAKAKK